jgi:hypothetical protein
VPAANKPTVLRCRYCVSEGQFRLRECWKTEGRFVRNAVTYYSLKTKRSGVPVRNVLTPECHQKSKSISEFLMSSFGAPNLPEEGSCIDLWQH